MTYGLLVNEDEWGADICSHPADVSTLAFILPAIRRQHIKIPCCRPGREEVLANNNQMFGAQWEPALQGVRKVSL